MAHGKKCFILRGLSGTGKSTLAETLKSSMNIGTIGYRRKHNIKAQIFSTDDLFMVWTDEGQEYQFDPSKLGEYHAKNLENATQFMVEQKDSDISLCIIDNTNTQHWEYEKYVEAAKENGFMVQVITVDWKREDIPLYAERNSHGVPEEAIQRMADRWEY